jgi:hypothetical protein
MPYAVGVSPLLPGNFSSQINIPPGFDAQEVFLSFEGIQVLCSSFPPSLLFCRLTVWLCAGIQYGVGSCAGL